MACCTGHTLALRQLEYGHCLHQILCLGVEAAGRSGHFFDQGSVLLRGLVHLHHSFPHLGDTSALLAAGRADLAHDVGHASDAGDHLAHGLAGLVHQRRALLYPVHAVGDQGLDFFGSFCAATGQGAHFSCHHGKAAALLACAGRFHCSVQGQDVGLEGNTINHVDDVGDLAAAVADAAHGIDHLADHFTTLHRHGRGALCQLVGLACVIGILFDGRRKLFHAGSRLFQGAGLALGACTQVLVALGNLAAGSGDRFGARAHRGYHFGQTVAHGVQIGQQAVWVATRNLHLHGQVAVRDFTRNAGGIVGFAAQGTRDGARDHPRQQRTHQSRCSGNDQHQQAGGVSSIPRTIGRGVHDIFLKSNHIFQRFEICVLQSAVFCP